MKKKLHFIAMLLGIMLLFVACKNNETDVMIEQIPETSSKELLAEGIEYLLQEDMAQHGEADYGDDVQDTEEIKENTSEEKAIETETEKITEEKETKNNASIQKEADTDHEQDDNTDKQLTGTIYYGNGKLENLDIEVINIEELNGDEILRGLAKKNIVSLDTKILSFTESNVDGKKAMFLDLSKSFLDYLKTMTEESECIILSSVSNTYLENFDGDVLYILIEGEILETKRGLYAQGFGKETPQEIMQKSMNAGELESNFSDYVIEKPETTINSGY